MAMFNSDLVDDLARQRVVLFLGSGVSASAETRAGGHMKGWAAFLRHTLHKVDAGTRTTAEHYLEKNDYLLACEILQKALPDDWAKLVVEEYGQAADPSPLHHALIALDQRIILTTNFDKLLETCWMTGVGSSTHLPTVFARIDPNVFRILKEYTSRFLVKIHGTVDDPETLIFSRSEYIRSAFGSPTYSSFLDSLLLNYTMLFVGFSMDDPAITSLLELYALRYPRARPHYMFSSDELPATIVDLNKRLRKLNIINYSGLDNHKALPGLIQELAKASEQRRRDLVAETLSR